MEKIAYMAPEMEVVDIEVRKMLCASDGTTEGGSDTLSGDITPGEPD